MNLPSVSTRSRRADAAAITLLAALAAIFFAPVLFANRALFWGDLLMGHYPAYELLRQGVAARDPALWNPYILGGFPQAADATFGYFYPTVFLYLALPLYRAMAIDLALHFFAAGAFTYLFLRRQGLGAGAGLVGAIIFAFSGFMAVRITQPPLIRVAALLPLMLWIVASVDDRPRLRSTLLLGVALGAQLLAGHHQTALISALLVGAYAVWEAARRGGPQSPVLRVLVGYVPVFALAMLLAVGLAAVQILPVAEFAGESDRSGGMTFESSSMLSFPPDQILMLVAPRLFGDPTTGRYWGRELFWEMTGYAGLTAILLAAVGVIASGRRERIFWAGAAASGVALALGRYTSVYAAAYYVIPGLAFFRVPARFLLWFGFAVAVLAAYGVDALRLREGSRGAWRLAAAVVGAVCLAAAWWAADAPGVRSVIDWLMRPSLAASVAASAPADALRYLEEVAVREGRRFLLLWALTGAAVLATRARRIDVRAGVAAAALLVGIDLFSFGMNVYPTADPRALKAAIPTERALNLEGGTYRIVMAPAFVNQLWTTHMTGTFVPVGPDWLLNYRAALIPNTNVGQRIANVYGNSPIYVHRMGQFLGTAISLAQGNGGASPLLDFMGARYVFSRADVGHTYQQVYRGGFTVWRNDRAMPRGWLVTDYQVLETDAQVARAFRTDWDPARTVILNRPPTEAFEVHPRPDPGTITRRSYGHTRVAFDVALTGPAIFVLSDTYYPGWRAYVDGKEHRIHRANHAFRAVFLPAGARHLEFVFRPRAVVAGGIISAAGWAFVAAVLGIGAVRRRGSARMMSH